MPTAKVPPSGSAPLRRRPAAWFGVVALLVLLAYARSCGAPFHFDDYTIIVANEEGSLSSLSGFLGFARTRLVPFATFALNYWVGGDDPFGYHAVNVAIHLLATLFVFNLALALCRTPRLRDTWLAEARLPFAVAAALFFACHPIQVQAVTYVVQRMSSLAAAFYVGSVLCYVRARNAQVGTGPGRPAAAFVGSIALALGALLSKENTASLPAAVMLAEWVFYGRAGLAKRLLRLTPYLLLVLVIGVGWKLLALGPGGRRISGSAAEQMAGLVRTLVFRANPRGDVAPLEYFFTQCVVIPRYLRIVVLPRGFNVDHDVAIQRILAPGVAGGMLFLAALLAFGLYAARRWPVLGFGITWSFVALSVESSFLPIRDAMVEHRMYLAMPGVALAVASGFAWLFQRQRAVAAVLGATAAALLCALTFLRNETWRTPEALWRDAVAKSPNKPRVHINLGMALRLAGESDEAITQYCRALALDPRNARARGNLDALIEEQADAALDEGTEIVLEGSGTGPEGSLLGLEPPDPCAGR